MRGCLAIFQAVKHAHDRKTLVGDIELLTTFFSGQCPTCGRPFRINMIYFGRDVCCSHCKATFPANGVSRAPDPRWSVVSRSARTLAKRDTLQQPVQREVAADVIETLRRLGDGRESDEVGSELGVLTR